MDGVEVWVAMVVLEKAVRERGDADARGRGGVGHRGGDGGGEEEM